jgi:type IV pilus assembly protein PilB
VSTEGDFLNVLVTRRFTTETEAMMLRAKFKGDLLSMVLHLAEKKQDRKHELGRFWGDHLGVVYLDLSRTLIQDHLLERLPEDFARKHLIMPVYEFGGAVTVVTPTPLDRSLLTQTESHMDAFVSPAFSFPDQVADALEIGYQSEAGLTKLLETTQIAKLVPQDGPVSVDVLRRMAGDEAIIRFVKGLFVLALKQRASDIHIESGEGTARVRFRIDGVLQNVFHLEPALLAPIITRLKVLATCDIAERRVPQDGGIKLTLAERSVDIRFSSVPTLYGEKVVLRLLGSTRSQAVPGLKQLGFSQDILRGVKRVLGHPNGIFLVTGPTGSGKTTTLYAMLQSLNTDAVNIMTIEDPVEYRLQGLTHMQVNPVSGLTFASALRATLRQDPNIILIGEIRDTETAQIATRAALTGHLVMTTLHTNGAVEAVSRLIDIGVEPYMLAPSVIGIMSQRLVRRLCDSCKDRYKLSREEVDRYFASDGKTDVYLYRACGCPQCGKIGYIGRLGIHELLMVDDDVRNMISQAAPLREIRACAERCGFRSLRYDGMKKALRGLTTMEEVDRVTILE